MKLKKGVSVCVQSFYNATHPILATYSIAEATSCGRCNVGVCFYPKDVWAGGIKAPAPVKLGLLTEVSSNVQDPTLWTCGRKAVEWSALATLDRGRHRTRQGLLDRLADEFESPQQRHEATLINRHVVSKQTQNIFFAQQFVCGWTP